LEYDKSKNKSRIYKDSLLRLKSWKGCGQVGLRRFEVLLYIVDSMMYKKFDHLSVSDYLQMILTGLTPLLHGHVVWRDVKILPKSLVVQLKILAQTPVQNRREAGA
jgi:hypothetical protein